VQAPFRVHADFSAGEPAMRDCERFPLGFTVPLVGHMGPAGVLAAGRCRTGRSRAVPVQGSAGGGRGGRALSDTAPKIIRGLPFVEREDHPAGLPVFAIAPAASGRHRQGCGDVERAPGRWGAGPAQALASLAEACGADRGFDGAALLVPVRQGQVLDRSTLRRQCRRLCAQPGSRRQPRKALYGHRRRPSGAGRR